MNVNSIDDHLFPIWPDCRPLVFLALANIKEQMQRWVAGSKAANSAD